MFLRSVPNWEIVATLSDIGKYMQPYFGSYFTIREHKLLDWDAFYIDNYVL